MLCTETLLCRGNQAVPRVYVFKTEVSTFTPASSYSFWARDRHQEMEDTSACRRRAAPSAGLSDAELPVSNSIQYLKNH